jgi:hypothetical protein
LKFGGDRREKSMAGVAKKAAKPRSKPAAGKAAKGELKVKHVLAALDQIGTLVAHVRGALEGADPETVIARSIRGGMGGPGEKPTVGQCEPIPTDMKTRS